MKPKVGQYHYAFRGGEFRIYRYTHVSDSGTCASEVIGEPRFSDREKARQRVYELNGWPYATRN